MNYDTYFEVIKNNKTIDIRKYINNFFIMNSQLYYVSRNNNTFSLIKDGKDIITKKVNLDLNLINKYSFIGNKLLIGLHEKNYYYLINNIYYDGKIINDYYDINFLDINNKYYAFSAIKRNNAKIEKIGRYLYYDGKRIVVINGNESIEFDEIIPNNGGNNTK